VYMCIAAKLCRNEFLKSGKYYDKSLKHNAESYAAKMPQTEFFDKFSQQLVHFIDVFISFTADFEHFCFTNKNNETS